MKFSVLPRLLVLAVVLFSLAAPVLAGVSASPSFLFMDQSQKSISFNVTNTETQDKEVWIEIKYGYETSTNNGKIFVHIDSTNSDGLSAAPFMAAYPQRFVLPGRTAQIVRLIANPSQTLGDGEYWARILVTSKPRKPTVTENETPTVIRPGITMMFQQSIPFHYRVGRLETGILVNSIIASPADSTIDLTLNLARTGNCAYWGSRTTKIISKQGRVVHTFTKNVGVYKTITLIDRISRADIPSGEYTIEVEFLTQKRTDVSVGKLVQARPLRATTAVVVP